MNLTSFEEFRARAEAGCRTPIVGEISNDLLTPVALYGNFASQKQSFLLESVEGGEKWGRFSFIGLFPAIIFRSKGRRVEITEGSKRRVIDSADPLTELKKALGRFRFVSSPDLPRFTGGAVGMVAYDMVRFFEKLPNRVRDDMQAPDLFFIIPEVLMMTYNLEQKLKILYDARI